MSESEPSLAELLNEGGEFHFNDISGGAKARYVRIYFETIYRFVDVTELVRAALELPVMLAGGMHTVAVYGTDAELAARIAERVTGCARSATLPPPPPSSEQGPAGGKRVKTRKPAPTRPPRGGALVSTK